MENAEKLIYDMKKLMLSKYPRFASEMATANIEYRTDLPYHTAATDGKNVFIDPDYFRSLSDSDRVFLIAHEIMHIKFAHAYRLEDKDGNRRNPSIWNIATDAIINANLGRDGFTIKEGYINRPEALEYTAEEFYQILLQEMEEEKSQQSQDSKDSQDEKGESQSQDSGQGTKNDGNEKQEDQNEAGKSQNGGNKQHGDDHSLWEKAFERYKNGKLDDKSQDNDDTAGEKSEEELESKEGASIELDEKAEFDANRQEKRERFKRRRESIEKEIRGETSEKIQFGDVGDSKESIDWRGLLRREIDKSETIWSQRRSIAENNYAYRLEEYDIPDEAESEVMIDVSGSVNLDLVKAFLRELKPILKHSKLRVGCFNEKFWGMVDVKTTRDIDNFNIPKEARGHSAWTEDWDLAVRSFSKKREINKIVFTDGWPQPGTMPKDDLIKENVIWLVYGNKDFNPCCGKVINITEKQLERLQHAYSRDGGVER